MATTIEIIADDIKIICHRIFEGHSITYFGADGGGRHGQCDHPKTSSFLTMDINVAADDWLSPTTFNCTISLELDNYSAAEHGHIMTDKNFRIGLDNLLRARAVDPKAFDWAPLALQKDSAVCLKIDVPLLGVW